MHIYDQRRAASCDIAKGGRVPTWPKEVAIGFQQNGAGLKRGPLHALPVRTAVDT
jgi:hypothetical protein